MRLRTLGGLELTGSDFKQPKPLLLLAYLCLEGPQERRRLAELFWPEGAKPMSNLTTVLARLKKVGERVREADELRVWTELPCDALELFDALDKGALEESIELYQGRFLEAFYLKDVGAELEEWVYAKREAIASQVRAAQLSLAEQVAAQSNFAEAAQLAERAYLLPGAAEPGNEELERTHRLLKAGSSRLAEEVRKEAESFGVSLSLTVEEAQQQSTAARAERVTPHNLMPRATPFVGRDAEITALRERLGDPSCRLLSIVGPGGIGKTGLAIEVARAQLAAFQDGVYFVSLVPVSSPSLMAYAVSDALDLTLLGTEEPNLQLVNHLRDKAMLLVLDNLEHLLGDLSLLQALLEQAPQVKLLVTSREPLNLQAEHVFDLRGLPVPEGADHIEAYDAVRLFLQSARQRRADFGLDEHNAPAVSRICQLVQGMPLALELAANWLRVLTVDDIAAEIEKGIDFLQASTRDSPERHQNIRAVFDHSWRLLSADEQDALRRLAVFQGGFRREAAMEVAGASLATLAALVDKSLLRIASDGRYRRHPLVIQYTQEKLAEHPEEKAQLQEKHGLYYLLFVREREKELLTSKGKETLKAIEKELPNIRAAWTWLIESEKLEELKTSALVLDRAFRYRIPEARTFFAQAVAALDANNPDHRVALGYVLTLRGPARQGLELLLPSGDTQGIMLAKYWLGMNLWIRGDLSQARTLLNESLALSRKHPDPPYTGAILYYLALIERECGTPSQVKRFFEEALAEVESLGDPQNLALLKHDYGVYLARHASAEEGERLVREGLKLIRECHVPGMECAVLANLAFVSYKLGKHDEAETLALEAMALAEKLHMKAMVTFALTRLARVALARGNYPEAHRHLQESLRATWEMGHLAFLVETLVLLSELTIAQGHAIVATEWLGMVQRQPAFFNEHKLEVERLLEMLRKQLSPEALEEALARGKKMKLEEIIDALLADRT